MNSLNDVSIHKIARRRSWAAVGYGLCGLGFILTIVAFYPGYMSPDSMANWLGGRLWIMKDIHAPVMTALWGLIDRVIPGPAPMLILQNAVFWLAAAIYWQATWRKSLLLGLCLVALAFMPQIWSQMSTIWKDTGMGAALFLASALLYHSSQTKSKVSFLASFPFLFYGYAVRLNAAPAVLPLAIWTGYIARDVFPPLRSNRFAAKLPIAVGLICFVLLTTALLGANRLLTGGKTVYPLHQTLLYDLAAISVARDENMFPDYISQGKNFSLEKVKARYNINSLNDLIWDDSPNPGDKAVLDLIYDPVPVSSSEHAAKIASLRAKWLKAVSENPGTYLYHRWRVFQQLIGFTTKGVSNPYWVVGFASNPPEFRREPGLLNRILMKYYKAFSRSPFFRGAFWMLICIGLLYFSIKNKLRREWDVVFVHATSALLFTLSYFFTTPSSEFRYLLWSMLASAIALSFAIFLIRAKRKESRAAR